MLVDRVVTYPVLSCPPPIPRLSARLASRLAPCFASLPLSISLRVSLLSPGIFEYNVSCYVISSYYSILYHKNLYYPIVCGILTYQYRMILCIFLFRISGTGRDCARSTIIKIAKKKSEKLFCKSDVKGIILLFKKKEKLKHHFLTSGKYFFQVCQTY